MARAWPVWWSFAQGALFARFGKVRHTTGCVDWWRIVTLLILDAVYMSTGMWHALRLPDGCYLWLRGCSWSASNKTYSLNGHANSLIRHSWMSDAWVHIYRPLSQVFHIMSDLWFSGFILLLLLLLFYEPLTLRIDIYAYLLPYWGLDEKINTALISVG